MAWIKVIKEGEAEDDLLRAFYKKYGDPFSGVDNIMKIHSLNPESMWKHYDYFKHIMTGRSGLSRMQREMIAVVVSAQNNCEYCLEHHKENLMQLTANQSLCEKIATDYASADVGDKDVAMMGFAQRLTKEPGSMRHKHVKELREAGFKDGEILDIVQVTAYVNFVNRMASGLGVELEPRFTP